LADNSTGLPVQTLTGQFVSIKLVDSGGANVAAVSAAGRLSVDASGVAIPISTIAGAITPGTAATSLGKAEDAAHASGDTCVFVLAVRNDAGGALATTDGDYIPFTTDATGALRVTGGSGGTQYTGDAAATSTPTVTIAGALANASAPADVSANNDAVAVWALRNGSQVVNLASGGTLVTIGQKTMANSLPVVLASDQSTLAVSLAANQTVNLAQVGGTNVVTGGVNGTLGVGGVLAHDAAAAAALPVGIGGFASAAAPTDVSADGDAVKIWALRNGSQVVNLASGGTLVTIGQKAMASSLPVVIASDQSNLPANITQIGGSAPGATNPLAVRLTDGASFYAASSGAPSSPQFSTQNSSALGAGASVDLTGTVITNGTTGQLMGVDVASTVPLKIEVKTVNSGGTATTRIVLFAPPYSGLMWRAPYKTFITQAGAATNAAFRVTVTNKDANTAADVYATLYWDQV